jgi:Tfp pilus assembly PilM family ATPase/Tfp pilus assembly protein PilN
MARILAIDWDRREVRCVLASSTGGRLRILSARSAPLVDVAEGGGASHPDVSGALRAVLDEARAGRSEILVAVDRASVELLALSLPPAKDSELPGLVAMQVLRESQTADENSIIDFTSLGDTGDPGTAADAASQPRQVAVAVLSAKQLERISATCGDAGLKPTRILLRPFAVASLFARRVSPAERNCLLVNQVADEADLLVLVDGRVVFQRTIRLPEDAAEELVAQRLSAEVNRTLLVAQQGPLGGNSVERVFVFGGSDDRAVLVDQLNAVLNAPVSLVDPFTITDIPEAGPPEHSGRFAALVGMILDETFSSHAIDFLHPRRPPRPRDRRQILAVVASMVILFGLAGAYYVWSEITARDAEISRLAAELKDKTDLVKRTAEQSDRIEAIRDWQESEVNWLDELQELSLRLPTARDLVVLRMSMLPDRTRGGSVEFSGLVRDNQIVARMEQNLRDEFHRDVSSKRIQNRGQGRGYSWGFETSVSVAARDKQSYLPQQASAR